MFYLPCSSTAVARIWVDSKSIVIIHWFMQPWLYEASQKGSKLCNSFGICTCFGSRGHGSKRWLKLAVGPPLPLILFRDKTESAHSIGSSLPPTGSLFFEVISVDMDIKWLLLW